MKKIFIIILSCIGFIACAQTKYTDLSEITTPSGTDGYTMFRGGSAYKMTHSTLLTASTDTFEVIRDSLDNYWVLLQANISDIDILQYTVGDSAVVSLKTNTITEYTGGSGTTIETVHFEDGQIDVSENKNITFDGGTGNDFITGSSGTIAIAAGGGGNIFFETSHNMSSKDMDPSVTDAIDLGGDTLWWDNTYSKKYYVDSVVAYIDYNFATNQMRFTDPVSGSLFLGDFIVADDTAAMLSPYLLEEDTAAMLSVYIEEGDTAAMLTNYALLIEAILPADTAAMLAPYLLEEDTAAMLTNYLEVGEGGTAYWSKTGTDLSPTTAGDDIALLSDDTIYWGADTWIYGDDVGESIYLGTKASWKVQVGGGGVTIAEDLVGWSSGSYTLGTTGNPWVNTYTEQLTVDPKSTGSQIEGSIYYDAEDDKFYGWNGTKWEDFSRTISIRTSTASDTIDLTDNGNLIRMNVAAANNLTVVTNAIKALPIGYTTTVENYGAGKTSILAGPGVTIHSADAALDLRVQYSAATLIKEETDIWLLSGDIQ